MRAPATRAGETYGPSLKEGQPVRDPLAEGERGGLLVALATAAILAAAACRATAGDAPKAATRKGGPRIVVTIVYDNNAFDERLRTGWGFACVVEGLAKTILFDTGADGAVLLTNMARAGFKPEQVDTVVLSHIHGDHTGGLAAFLRANPRVSVCVPRVFPAEFKAAIRRAGAQLAEADGPCKVCEGAWTTGVLTQGIAEHGLTVTSAQGPVVITGCAHPGVARLVDAARRHARSPVHAVLGGFHMGGASDQQIHAAIQGLRKAGVQRAAPCHCSGDRARELMKEAFGEGYLPSGVGTRLVFEGRKQEKTP